MATKKKKSLQIKPNYISGDFATTAPSAYEYLHDFLVACAMHYMPEYMKVIFIDLVNAQIQFSPKYAAYGKNYIFDGMNYRVVFGHKNEEIYTDSEIYVKWYYEEAETLEIFSIRLIQQAYYTLVSFLPGTNAITVKLVQDKKDTQVDS